MRSKIILTLAALMVGLFLLAPAVEAHEHHWGPVLVPAVVVAPAPVVACPPVVVAAPPVVVAPPPVVVTPVYRPYIRTVYYPHRGWYAHHHR